MSNAEALIRALRLGERDQADDPDRPMRDAAELREVCNVPEGWVPDNILENMYAYGRAGTPPEQIVPRRAPD